MTSDAFDKDMTRLFEKARRWHPEGSVPYGEILILQVRPPWAKPLAGDQPADS
jgi:hypothetical protein